MQVLILIAVLRNMPILEKKKENLLVAISLFLFTMTMIWLAFTTKGTGDWGDAIYHYLFSRFAFAHPENFLNHWAKPVFVLLTAPVAQGGFIAMKVFNVALLVGSSWFAWRVGKLLAVPNAWLVVFPLMTAPMNISHTLSGLTEPMFAFWLIVGIYWFVKEKPFSAVLWLSFLPFVRSEGLIVFCVVLIYLVLKNWWKYIPVLAVGHLVYSLVGYFYYQDFLWVFTKMPYATVKGAYGSGEFWHYANKMHQVMGDFLPILLLIGLLAGAIRLVKFWLKKDTFSIDELWLIYGVSVAFFLAHSIFWRFGIFNSFGLTRVFMGVLPLYALIIVQGVNLVLHPIKKTTIHLPLIGLLVATMFFYLDKKIDLHFHLAPTSSQKGQNELIEKYASQYEGYMYYFDAIHPSLALDLDWFDPNKHRYTPQLFTGEPIPSKSLVLWDDWFSLDESNIPLENLTNDKRFRLIECLETGYDWEHPKKKNCLFEFDSTYANATMLLDRDFETRKKWTDTTIVKSGAASFRMDKQQEFSPGFTGWLSSFHVVKEPVIRLSCWVYLPENINPATHAAKAVISFESNYKAVAYHAKPIFQEGDQRGKWKRIVYEQPIIKNTLMNDVVRVYIWNPDPTTIYIDDMKVDWYHTE